MAAQNADRFWWMGEEEETDVFEKRSRREKSKAVSNFSRVTRKNFYINCFYFERKSYSRRGGGDYFSSRLFPHASVCVCVCVQSAAILIFAVLHVTAHPSIYTKKTSITSRFHRLYTFSSFCPLNFLNNSLFSLLSTLSKTTSSSCIIFSFSLVFFSPKTLVPNSTYITQVRYSYYIF